jgi:hypothetical protein
MEVAGPKCDRLWLEGRRDSWQEERERGAQTGRTLQGNGPTDLPLENYTIAPRAAKWFLTSFSVSGVKCYRTRRGRSF